MMPVIAFRPFNSVCNAKQHNTSAMSSRPLFADGLYVGAHSLLQSTRIPDSFIGSSIPGSRPTATVGMLRHNQRGHP